MINNFPESDNSSNRNKEITIVSGLPRSGTSLMMQMLVAGGMQALTDNIRSSDMDNPKGYYEFERVKKLREGDTSWLKEAENKVMKVIALLLLYLPPEYNYKIVFMRRSIPEILASQRKMLINRGEDPDKVPDEELARLFQKHLNQIDSWINEHENTSKIDINYKEIVTNPIPDVARINQFLGGKLDEKNMTDVVDPSLYRQRRS